MILMSDISKDEWDALKRLLHGETVRRINSQTVKRLTDIGALQNKRGGIELSYAAMRLLSERMARISRARNSDSQTRCN